MYGVVTQATIHDFEQAKKILNEQGIPRLSQAPGFVSGHWVLVDENRGRGMLIFESEEAAQAGAEMVRANAPGGPAITVDSIDVGEVVGHA